MVPVAPAAGAGAGALGSGVAGWEVVAPRAGPSLSAASTVAKSISQDHDRPWAMPPDPGSSAGISTTSVLPVAIPSLSIILSINDDVTLFL